MLHLPILRQGRPYRSVEVATVPHFRTKQPFAGLSQANSGLVRLDLREERQAAMRASLAAFRVKELVAICHRAAEAFTKDTLPLGDLAPDLVPADFVAPADDVVQVGLL